MLINEFARRFKEEHNYKLGISEKDDISASVAAAVENNANKGNNIATANPSYMNLTPRRKNLIVNSKSHPFTFELVTKLISKIPYKFLIRNLL